MLRSLPASFDTLTTALETRSESDLALELIKSKLVDEVIKRENGSNLCDSVFKAGSEKQKKTLLFYFFRKQGHKQKQC